MTGEVTWKPTLTVAVLIFPKTYLSGSANSEYLPYIRHIWKNKFLNIHCFHNPQNGHFLWILLHVQQRGNRGWRSWLAEGHPARQWQRHDSDLSLFGPGLLLCEYCLLENPSIPKGEGGRKQNPHFPEFWFSSSVDWQQTSSYLIHRYFIQTDLDFLNLRASWLSRTKRLVSKGTC